MTHRRRNAILVLLCVASLAMLWAVERYGIQRTLRSDEPAMRQARDLAASWFDIVLKQKDSLGLTPSDPMYSGSRGLLGEEYSDFTTTLGSFEAKETTLNPEFAALVVRILHDAGIDSTCTIGVTLSGSFPALGISTLAALQTLGMHSVLMSSLGASSFGANQPGATWLDIERWLAERGGLTSRSALATFGGESDSGGGITEEGLETLKTAAARAKVSIFVPKTISEAIGARVTLLSERKIAVLINIGGNQAVLGGCIHATTYPNGFHRTLRVCDDPDRGVIAEMNARGVPVLHFLNIKDLASRYGLPLAMPDSGEGYGAVYRERTVTRAPIWGFLLVVSAALFGIARMGRRI